MLVFMFPFSHPYDVYTVPFSHDFFFFFSRKLLFDAKDRLDGRIGQTGSYLIRVIARCESYMLIITKPPGAVHGA